MRRWRRGGADPQAHGEPAGGETPARLASGATSPAARAPEAGPDTVGTQVLPRPAGATGAGGAGAAQDHPPASEAAVGPAGPNDPDVLVTELVRRLPASGSSPTGSDLAHTQALDPALASAAADPFRDTTLLQRSAPAAAPTAAEPQGPTPLLSRRRAAEVGLYCGASLVLLAVLGMGVRGWGEWNDGMRAAASALAALALLASGLFLRLPWGRPMGQERTRAVSVLLGTGVAASLVGAAIVLGISQSSDRVGAAVHAGIGVLALVGVNALARTPYSETLLLGALSWAGWVALPWRPGMWLVLVALGLLWLLAGYRFARGRRTAAVAGCAVALAAGAALAAEPGAWVARGLLAAVTAVGLGLFLAGWANAWLALGAAAATALAVGVAADALSPAPALMIGGLATMAVSGVALRSAGRVPGGSEGQQRAG